MEEIFTGNNSRERGAKRRRPWTYPVHWHGLHNLLTVTIPRWPAAPPFSNGWCHSKIQIARSRNNDPYWFDKLRTHDREWGLFFRSNLEWDCVHSGTNSAIDHNSGIEMQISGFETSFLATKTSGYQPCRTERSWHSLPKYSFSVGWFTKHTGWFSKQNINSLRKMLFWSSLHSFCKSLSVRQYHSKW
jgi:hypothetical protein